MLLNALRYVRLNIKIRKTGEVIYCPETGAYTDRKINVRVWENVASPFMTGVFRPTLILPKMELSGEQLDNILRHEMTHFKRNDILYKWFAEFVKCVHWFNPMAWYVSKQIASECEISCDMSVTKNMSGSEEMSYVSTILSLLPTGKSKQLPLTTQMASSKKFLKRRFVMIKNKKTTSRFMSVISAVIAAIMLSTTVFASGVLSDLTTDDYTIEITNNGEKIELTNKPFIENGEVYVPLRETLEKLGFDKNNSNIVWKDGKVGLSLVQTNGNAGAYCIKIGYNGVWCSQESTVLDNTALDYIIDNSRGYIDLANSVPHILKNSFTYISIEYFDYIVYRFLNVRDENNELYEITYNVYDKNGDVTAIPSAENAVLIQTSPYDNKTPEYAIDQFFNSFAGGDFENMKRCCTQNCIDKYFNIYSSGSPLNNVFDMTTAKIIGMGETKDYGENSKVTYVTVKCVRPPHSSFFDPDGERNLKIVTVRGTGGGYLIDSFIQ